MVWIIIIILLSSADQLLKAVIRAQMGLSESIPVIDGFFYIINRKNPGAAWSFLAGQSWGIYVLAAISAIFTVLLVVILLRINQVKMKACLTLICAGSLGNLIDRISAGGVTDYLDFHFGNYIFPTFNLADILIVCGSILLGLLILLDPSLLANLQSDSPARELQAATGEGAAKKADTAGADDEEARNPAGESAGTQEGQEEQARANDGPD